MQRREFLEALFAAAAFAPHAFAVQSQETRRILYVLGQFSQATPESMQAAVETIGGSSFNVLILSFLQASQAGGKLTLLYNGNPVSSLSPEVPALLARLRSGFGARKRVMLSIGGWQNVSTFAAIRSVGVVEFVRQLTDQVIHPLGFDGIDIDLEPQTGGIDYWIGIHHDYGKLIVDLTNQYKRVHPTHLVTHSPLSFVAAEVYVKPTTIPGLTSGLLAATRTNQRNNIDWLNVQLYEGGLVPGGDIAGYYRESLAAPLMQIRKQTGIHSPLHFLTPLFEPQAHQPLAFCRQTIDAINQRCATLHAGRISGVALWDYHHIARSIGSWSAGLDATLHKESAHI